MRLLLKSGEADKILVWVFFTDKGNTTDLYFAHPTLAVSEKSLMRRMKLGSSIDITDLPVNKAYIDQIEDTGLKLRQKSRWFNGISGYTTKENISRIAGYPFVQKIDLVYGFKINYNDVEKDNTIAPDKIIQPDALVPYNYGISYTQLQQINVPAVHNLGYRGQGVTVCVMDAGFNRLTHECFIGMNIIAAWDFVNGDGNVGDEGDMGSGTHGTQTLSTIGGFKEGQLIGPAFDADYILAKTENTDSETPVEEDNWIAAMEWADSIGVDVTSTSLGYLFMDTGYPGYTWQDMNGNTAIITKGADLATHKGIVVVNSAGNEGYNGTPNTLSAPADGDSVIAVGAVNSEGTRVGFSGFGPTVDGRIKPDIMAMGSSVYVASPSNNTQYIYSSGTSFSCPLAAGVAALVLCYNPNLTPMQVRDALRLTASQSTSPDNYYGWGIINALNAMNYFPATFQLTVNVSDGWNVVSIPGLLPTNQNVSTWWIGKDPAAGVFKFNGSYSTVTTAEPGTGYWMKNLGARVYNTGDEWPAGGIQFVSHNPLPGMEGWNLFGGYEQSVPAAGLTTTPPGLISGSVYKYSGGYQTTTTIDPGYGYWVKLTGAGSINFPADAPKASATISTENFGKIIITDNAQMSYTLYAVDNKTDVSQFDLPPYPPQGMFDVRYSSQRCAENLSTEQAIEMTGVQYPVKVKAVGTSIILSDETGKEIARLKAGEEVTINTAGKLYVSGNVIPSVYSLEQNYPNPFNPGTTIQFSIPEDVQNVKLIIYSALGEKVAELVNTGLQAGIYKYTWNANNVSSGLYIYQVVTEKFVSTKKMVLLK